MEQSTEKTSYPSTGDSSITALLDRPALDEAQPDITTTTFTLSSPLLRELLSPGPGNLLDVKAALYFIEGQLILHYRQNGGEYFKPVSAQAVASAFATQALDTGWLPPGIIRWGRNKQAKLWLVKLIPAQVHTLTLTHLRHAKMAGEDDVRTIKVPLPPLLFAGVGTEYYVWALKLSSSLAPDGSLDGNAIVYHAPLPNVYDSGRICFGQNTPPPADWNTIERTWRLFITDAPYNADLSNKKSKTYPKDVRAQLLALAEQYEAGRTASRNRKQNLVKAPEGLEYPLSDLLPMTRHNYQDGKGEALTLNHVARSYLTHENQYS
jgi:hypothetical protein